MESSFACFQTLPISELSPEDPINQAWEKRRATEKAIQDE
jgi:hypothetical protein